MPRAIVVGAGIAGLTAAIALRGAGYAVAVYEQAPSIEPMGAALSIWPNALAGLDRLGCGDALRARAVSFDQAQLCDWQGRTLSTLSARNLSGAEDARLPTRAVLQSLLLDAAAGIPLRLGARLAYWNQSDDEVAVRFDDGAADVGDLLVVADGIWSATATALIGNAPRHAGYGGVLAITSPGEDGANDVAAAEYWGWGQRFGIFPVDDERHYWFYMRNEASPAESRDLTLETIARLTGGGPEAIGAALRATDAAALIPFSIHARPAPDRLGAGRILCVGDAAHAMEPNMGQGGCQAIEDAVALGAAASRVPPEQVLGEYERLRLERIRRFVTLSRQGALVPHRLPKSLAAVARGAIRMTRGGAMNRVMKPLLHLPDY